MVPDFCYTAYGEPTGRSRMFLVKTWWRYKVVVEVEYEATIETCPPPRGAARTYDRTEWRSRSPWNYLGRLFMREVE